MNIYSAEETKARNIVPKNGKFLYCNDNGVDLWVFYILNGVGYKTKLSSTTAGNKARNKK